MQSAGSHWRKSSVSQQDDCVECRHDQHAVSLRDSKNRAGPRITLPLTGWAAFLTSVAQG
jgi:hypothetical protein